MMFPDDLDEREEIPASGAGMNSLSRIVLWLVIISLGLMFVPLYLASTSLKEIRPTLEAQLSEIAVTLNTTPELNTTQQALNDQLLQVRGQVMVLESLQGTLTTGYLDWSTLMGYIGTFNADQMGVVGVTQSADSLMLTGKASSEAVVMAYVQHLRENAQFETVTIQTINIDLTPPTPTPESAQPGVVSSSGQAVTFTLLVHLVNPAEPVQP